MKSLYLYSFDNNLITTTTTTTTTTTATTTTNTTNTTTTTNIIRVPFRGIFPLYKRLGLGLGLGHESFCVVMDRFFELGFRLLVSLIPTL